MKRSLYLALTCALAALVTVSCDDDFRRPTPLPTPEPGDPAKVAVVGDMGNYTISRGGFSSWREGDRVGLFWRRAEGYSPVAPFTVDASTIDDATGSVGFDGELLWDASGQQQFFYAMSPCPSGEGLNPERMAVSLPGVQTQQGNSPAAANPLNVMVASPVTGVAPDFARQEAAKPVNFSFTPLFSLVEFRLMAYNDAPVALNSIKIESVTPGVRAYSLADAEVNITTPAISGYFADVTGGTPGYSMQLNLTDATLQATDETRVVSDPKLPADEKFLTAHVMMLPGSYSAGGFMRFTFDTSAGEFTVERPAFRLSQGNKTVVTMLVPVLPLENAATPWDGSVADGPTTLDMDGKVIEIATAEELAWLAAVVNRDIEVADLAPALTGYTVTLLTDIDLNNLDWTPIGKNYGLFGSTAFGGRFDGDGYSISNLKCTSIAAGANCVGLFGTLNGATAGISNLNLDGSIEMSGVTGANYIGTMAGYLNGSSASPMAVDNCHVNVAMNVAIASGSSRVGGFSGNTYNSNINNCTVEGDITIDSASTSQLNAGGFTAYLSGGYLANSGNYADIALSGTYWFGGLTGYATGSVNGCLNAGDITITPPSTTGSIVAGGLLGQVIASPNSTVASCYNSGDITISPKAAVGSFDCVAGVIAYFNGDPAVRGCYNSGTITASGGGLDEKKGNVFAYMSDTGPAAVARISDNYYAGAALPIDQNAGLAGKVTQFSSTAWPVSSNSGWGTGEGTAANTYWRAPLPAYSATEYPRLWWEK